MSKASTTKSSGGSVIYVFTLGERIEKNRSLLAAQREALKHRLPLAVVWCVEPPIAAKTLATMASVEGELIDFAIPLMTLLGDAKKTLPGLIFHVQPQSIFDKTKASKADGRLQLHPHPWPGVVLPLSSLFTPSGEAQLNC